MPRETILAAVSTYQLVEAYPNNKYFPSYLILARHGSDAFHVRRIRGARLAEGCVWELRRRPPEILWWGASPEVVGSG